MTLTSIINTMTEVVTLGVPWGFLLLLFCWNLYKLITESDNAEKRKQAVPRLVWSIIAITIVFSIGGIVNILSNTLLGTKNSTFAPSGSSSQSGLSGGSQGGTGNAPSSGSSGGGGSLLPGQQQI